MVVRNQFNWTPLIGREELRERYVVQRKTVQQIADSLHCSEKVVHTHLKKYGINLRDRYPTKEQLVALYVEKKMTLDEIALHFKLKSAHIIENLMRRYGIPRRVAAKRDQFGERNVSWKGGRMTHNGYVYLRRPDHPRAVKGYVAEHDLMMEEHLGRHLKVFGFNDTRNEVVHHLNEEKQDNRIENMMLTTHGEHQAIHRRLEASRRNGG